MTNFYQQLELAFTSNAAATALHLADGSRWSYQNLLACINTMSAQIVAAGIAPGERVLVQVDKSPENLALYLACLKRGLVYVPLNTAYTATEIDYFVADAQPALYVGPRRRHDVVCADLSPASVAENGTDFDFGLCLQLYSAITQSTSAQAIATAAATIEPRRPSDLAAILYTSGTTGRSKGAMLSHANLSSNAHALVTCWGWRSDDVLLHALPIFHVHGLFIASHCALLTGTAMIFLPKFDAGQVCELLPNATVMMGVPTFYTRLLQEPQLSAEHVKNIRVFISGSAPLTPQTFTAWEQATSQRILERYGMSETIINTSNPLLAAAGERLPGSVGFALPGQEVRVTDQQGVPLPAGEVGMIEVRGPNVFEGYWQMPEKTREEKRDSGFFITGDLGSVSTDGRLAIVGRSKDLVISGGYNVYPKEVEAAIDVMPEVFESAVIGVPHKDFGEAVVAVVVPSQELVGSVGTEVFSHDWQPVSEALVSEALVQRLARFKQPKAVINVAELPRNTMGKVQKNVLRERYTDLFAK